ncbi:MAG TPA: antitoxin Xre/MbcA/ParS toxin-binding domain-containing protein [Rhizomicrobium sp.]|jgi:uncharacterized protein (DUF2384 family)
MSASTTNVPASDPSNLVDGEGSIAEKARKMFASPAEWLAQKHPMLGGRSPQECLDAHDEQPVRDLLRRIKYVGQT